MIYSACDHDNPADSRFCGGCGLQLARRCAACAAELPADSTFCNACGNPIRDGDIALTAALSHAAKPERAPAIYTPKHLADKILTSRAALEGERKQVTVLFADVKGSMDLSSQLDPEQWHDVPDQFFSILTTAVHCYEGNVNQYTGDGIMALFGAPIAHEDHAQRACYAALDARHKLTEYAERLRIEKGLHFAVRIGLNSGDVVVGKIGDDLRMDRTYRCYRSSNCYGITLP